MEITTFLVSMGALLAMLPLAIGGVVRQPGNLIPGLEGVQEEVETTITISDSATSGTATLSLSGDYDTAPDVVGIAFSRENSSGGDASSYVAGYDVDGANATVDAVDVDIHLDTAPGSGESVDVVATAWVSGDANK